MGRPRAPRAPPRTASTWGCRNGRRRTRRPPGCPPGGTARRTWAQAGAARPAPARAGPRGPPGCRPLAPSGLEQRASEVVGVERPQVLEALADADQLDRHAELLRDGERDAPLRGSVELGED